MATKNGEITVNTDKKTKGIKRLMPIETYLAEFVDGSGRPQTRITFRIPGEKRDLAFILQERVSGTLVATKSHKWFEDDMNSAFRQPKRKPRTRKAAASV